MAAENTRSPSAQLHLAAGRGQLDVMRELLARDDVDVNYTDDMGWTAVMSASHRDQGAAIRLLAAHDAHLGRPCSIGTFPLLNASRNGRVNAVRALLGCGAVVDQTDWYGVTALYQAVAYRHEDVVRVLVDAGADPERKSPHSRLSPRKIAKRIKDKEARNRMLMLLKRTTNAERVWLMLVGMHVGAAADGQPNALVRLRAHEAFDVNVLGEVVACLMGDGQRVGFVGNAKEERKTKKICVVS